MARLAVGVDFGGTNVLSGVVNVETGEVLGQGKKKTSAKDDGDQLVGRITSTVDAALRDADVARTDIEGIGVGIAGQVDVEQGLLIGTANLSRSVVDLPLAQMLTKEYGVPVAIRNDVHIAAVGEWRFGAGRGTDDFLVVFVGTGIGGGFVKNGELITGFTGNAGELGHTIVAANGRICGCGGRGHLEAYASRTAITTALLGELRRGRKSILRELLPDLDPTSTDSGTIKSGVLRKAIKAEDDVVTEVINEAGTYLGYGLASVVNFLNPQRIILGGGVIGATQILYDQAVRVTRREAFANAGEQVEIVKAKLGDDSGVVGAAVIATEL